MVSITNEFRNIPTTCISDAMDGLNNMHPAIKPLKEEYKFAGRAFTVKIPVGDNLAVLKAIRLDYILLTFLEKTSYLFHKRK